MFLIEKITKTINDWRQSITDANVTKRREQIEHEALRRFNISSFDGKPVIIYNDVVITVPNDKTTGDSLIQSMLKLREIYVQSRCRDGQV